MRCLPRARVAEPRLPTPSDPAGQRPTAESFDWNRLTAVMAVLVGALALAVSVYTARLQQLRVRAQVWPHLAFAFLSDQRSVQLLNKGVGPASLEWVTVANGDSTLQGWSELFAQAGLSRETVGGMVYSSLEPQLLAAGEAITVLQFANEQGWQAFQSARRPLKVTFCYCSVLQECRVRGAEAGEFGEREWLPACPSPPRTPFRG